MGSMDIERGSPCPEKRSNAACFGNAARSTMCRAFRLVMAPDVVMPVLSEEQVVSTEELK
jgi:hypothetical protein